MVTSKNTLKDQVAKKIRALRRRKKLTQEELAEKAGFHYKYYQRIESGGVNLTLESIEKLSSALNVRPKLLLP